MKKITSEIIKRMSYTDFVGFINQWNVLPGSFNTLFNNQYKLGIEMPVNFSSFFPEINLELFTIILSIL